MLQPMKCRKRIKKTLLDWIVFSDEELQNELKLAEINQIIYKL